jgi:AsmA protein
LDFRVDPKFVATLKGQEDTKERAGISVPVLVSGTFTSPKFRPDLKGIFDKSLKEGFPKPSALKEMIKGESAKEGEEKPLEELEEKVKGLIKGLPFGQ